ncbi:MAG: transposase [Acidithiobacillus sp.]|nr:transposase [Acidithiobacillus sp.]
MSIRWFDSQISNSIVERFNSLLQSAKAKTWGYRTHMNIISMAYLNLSKLDLRIPS